MFEMFFIWYLNTFFKLDFTPCLKILWLNHGDRHVFMSLDKQTSTRLINVPCLWPVIEAISPSSESPTLTTRKRRIRFFSEIILNKVKHINYNGKSAMLSLNLSSLFFGMSLVLCMALCNSINSLTSLCDKTRYLTFSL